MDEDKGLAVTNTAITIGAAAMGAAGPIGIVMATALTAFAALQPLLGLGGSPSLSSIISLAMLRMKDWVRGYVDEQILAQFIAEQQSDLVGMAANFQNAYALTGDGQRDTLSHLKNTMDLTMPRFQGVGKAERKDMLPIFPVWASLHLAVLREYSKLDPNNAQANLAHLQRTAQTYIQLARTAVAEAMRWRLAQIALQPRPQEMPIRSATVVDLLERKAYTQMLSVSAAQGKLLEFRDNRMLSDIRHWQQSVLNCAYAWHSDEEKRGDVRFELKDFYPAAVLSVPVLDVGDWHEIDRSIGSIVVRYSPNGLVTIEVPTKTRGIVPLHFQETNLVVRQPAQPVPVQPPNAGPALPPQQPLEHSRTWQMVSSGAVNVRAGWGRAYEIRPDNTIWQYSGSPNQWNQIYGGLARAPIVTRTGVAFLSSNDQMVVFHNGQWNYQFGTALAFCEGGNRFFKIDKDHMAYMRDEGTGRWSALGYNAANLATAGNNLYITMPGSNSVLWLDYLQSRTTHIGADVIDLVGAGTDLFMLRSDRTIVRHNSQTLANTVEPNLSCLQLASDGSTLCALDTSFRILLRAQDGRWASVSSIPGGRPRMLAVNGNQIFAIRDSDQAVFQTTI